MQVFKKTSLQDLYEIDDSLWLEETIKLLKKKRLNDLDLGNLIEELEALSKSQYQSVKSWLYRIIIHILFLEYWTEEYERNYRYWCSEIAAFRFDLNNRLTTNFKNKLTQELETIYQKSIKNVQLKSGLELNIFPQKCPYNLEQLLDDNWYSK